MKKTWKNLLTICMMCLFVTLLPSVVNADDYAQGNVPDPKDAPDVMNEANSIALSRIYTSSLGSKNDVDWYKVKLPMQGCYYEVMLKNVDVYSEKVCIDDLKLEIYSFDETCVGQLTATKKQKETTEFTLKSDRTYYIKIYSPYGYEGNYKFSIQRLDDAGDEMKKAQEISFGKSKIYRMDSRKDVDWYKIKIPENGCYIVNFKNIDITDYWHEDDVVMAIYNANAKEIYRLNVDTKQSYTNTFSLERGTYYFKIYSPQEKTGKYKFGMKQVAK